MGQRSPFLVTVVGSLQQAVERLWRFGFSQRVECSINLRQLLSETELTAQSAPLRSSTKDSFTFISGDDAAEERAAQTMLFYDLYLLDRDEKLQPIPVKLQSLTADEQYGTRFFLLDNLGGRESSSTSQLPRVISVAQTVRFEIDLLDDQHISIPRLYITYEDRQSQDILTGEQEMLCNFEITYRKATGSLFMAIQILFAILGFFALLHALAQANFAIKAHGSNLSMSIFFGALTRGLGAISSIFLLLQIVFAAYCWIVYKGQSVPSLILYLGDPLDRLVQWSLPTAFCFSMVSLLYSMWKQANVDWFLIDFERQKRLCAFFWLSGFFGLLTLSCSRQPPVGDRSCCSLICSECSARLLLSRSPCGC